MPKKTKSIQLEEQIDVEMTHLRTDKLDITFGELANMYDNEELIIAPDYQRQFRWTAGQKSLFIESILLGFPTPAIFVAETKEGIWELVDGMQRISTILEFMGKLKYADGELVPPFKTQFSTDRHPLRLLDGFKFGDLELRTRLSIKRAGCRVEVIKVGSQPNMKYEVFERLNTGGSGLSHQEVRNCVFRSANPKFMEWVDKLSEIDEFSSNLGLPETGKFGMDEMYDKGLVLRFFTLKNSMDGFINEVEPFITDYVRSVVNEESQFDMYQEEKIFRDTFSTIDSALGEDAWRHFRDGKHSRKQFSVYVYDALTVGVANNLQTLKGMDATEVRDRLIKVKSSPEFRDNVGPGANTKAKLVARLNAAINIIANG